MSSKIAIEGPGILLGCRVDRLDSFLVRGRLPGWLPDNGVVTDVGNSEFGSHCLGNEGLTATARANHSDTFSDTA